MTRADAWRKRDCVIRYWRFKDALRSLGAYLPGSYHLHIILPMPESWGKNKREEMFGKPHLKRPDKDNLEKAILDAILDEDSHIWDGRVSKWWGEKGQIIVQSIEPAVFPGQTRADSH